MQNIFYELERQYHQVLNQTPKMDWLWQDVIYRGTVCMLDGAGGSGKSTLTMQIAAMCVFHMPFLIPRFQFARKEPGDDISRVLYLTVEDPWPIIYQRISSIAEAYHLNENILREYLTVINFFECKEPAYLVTEKKQSTDLYCQLMEYVQEKNFDLVILDPVIGFYGGDENSNSEVAHFFSLLRRLQTTVLITHHQNKEAKKNGNRTIAARGAIAFREQTRTRLCLQQNLLVIEKMNFSSTQGTQIPLVYRDGIFWVTQSQQQQMRLSTRAGKRVA